MSNPNPTTPTDTGSSDLNAFIQQQLAAQGTKTVQPFLGGVAENYVAPFSGSGGTSLEPGRLQYSGATQQTFYGPNSQSYTAPVPPNTPSTTVYYGPNGQSYQQPAGQGGIPTGVKPQYRQGSEQTIVAGMAPEAVFQLKQQLVDSGLASKNIMLSGGFWDSGSANAMQDILGYANVHGMAWQDALDQLAAESTTHPAPKDLLPPQVLSTKSPIDLRQTADTVAQATIGRKLTAAEQARFVTAWQTADLGYQRKQADITLAYQQAQQDITKSGTPPPSDLPPQISTLTAPPTPENAAKEALQNTPEGQAKNIADIGDTFMSLLKGIVPGAGG